MPAYAITVTVAALAMLTLSSCQSTDPVTRDRGDWHPSDVNEANLAVQVVNPAELSFGASSTGTDAEQSTAAIQRYHSGKVKPLEENSFVSFGTGAH